MSVNAARQERQKMEDSLKEIMVSTFENPSDFRERDLKIFKLMFENGITFKNSIETISQKEGFSPEKTEEILLKMLESGKKNVSIVVNSINNQVDTSYADGLDILMKSSDSLWNKMTELQKIAPLGWIGLIRNPEYIKKLAELSNHLENENSSAPKSQSAEYCLNGLKYAIEQGLQNASEKELEEWVTFNGLSQNDRFFGTSIIALMKLNKSIKDFSFLCKEGEDINPENMQNNFFVKWHFSKTQKDSDKGNINECQPANGMSEKETMFFSELGAETSDKNLTASAVKKIARKFPDISLWNKKIPFKELNPLKNNNGAHASEIKYKSMMDALVELKPMRIVFDADSSEFLMEETSNFQLHKKYVPMNCLRVLHECGILSSQDMESLRNNVFNYISDEMAKQNPAKVKSLDSDFVLNEVIGKNQNQDAIKRMIAYMAFLSPGNDNWYLFEEKDNLVHNLNKIINLADKLKFSAEIIKTCCEKKADNLSEYLPSGSDWPKNLTIACNYKSDDEKARYTFPFMATKAYTEGLITDKEFIWFLDSHKIGNLPKIEMIERALPKNDENTAKKIIFLYAGIANKKLLMTEQITPEDFFESWRIRKELHNAIIPSKNENQGKHSKFV